MCIGVCVCVRAGCEIMYWITRKAIYLYYYMTIFAAFEYEYAYAMYVAYALIAATHD